MRNMSELEMDTLREFVNIGSAHAANAMSKLIEKKVAIEVPEIRLVPIMQIPELLGGPEMEVVGLYFKVYGALAGNVLLFFPMDTARSLLSILTGEPDSGMKEFGELEVSAMMELGNILTNSYVNALAKLMDSEIFISVPGFSSDLLGAIVDLLLIQIAQVGDYAMLMDTDILSQETKLKGNFIIFPDSASLEKMIAKMGID